MKKRKLITRIIAIVLCALLVLGIGTVAIYALAASPEAAVVAAPETGSNDKIAIFAVVAAVAVIAAVVCIVTSSRTKKSAPKQDKKDGEDE